MCGSMVDIQSAAAEIRRGKKKKEKKIEERNHRAKILWPALYHRAAIISDNISETVYTREAQLQWKLCGLLNV